MQLRRFCNGILRLNRWFLVHVQWYIVAPQPRAMVFREAVQQQWMRLLSLGAPTQVAARIDHDD